jgi:phospholipase/carboxylesterase
MGTLDGPRILPVSGTAKQLVILCHGYGANGNDLIGLAEPWRSLLPDAAFVSPHAPEPMPVAPGGYQWFPMDRSDPMPAAARGVTSASLILNEFIDEELDCFGFDERQLALVGFSQGTTLALHVGVRRAVAPAAILAFSGMLAKPEYLQDELRVKPPIFLIHGELDPMIPIAALHATVNQLGDAGLTAQWHVSPGVPHNIGPDGVELGGRFLADSFASATNPA